VISYRSDLLPNFYCNQSNIQSPHRVESLEQVANIFRCRKKLCQPEGILLANPLPPSLGIDAQLFETELAQGLKKAQEQNISFQAVSPFLLHHLATNGQFDTVKANIELLKNNAQLAALLAALLVMDHP
jgi:pseudouridine-5'-phosphate glycosidase